MFRSIISITLVTFAVCSSPLSAEAKKPELNCLKKPIYKGVIGTLTKISSPAKIKDKFFDGWKYNYSYTFPNGYVGNGYTVLPGKTLKAKAGDYFVWVPANKAVRDSDPKKNSHVPLIIIKKTCDYYKVDWSVPAAEIPGF